jgi:hypothetical protein
VRLLWERLRWSMTVERTPGAAFVLNDHLTSRYARKIAAEHPALGAMFEVRELRSQ